MWVRTTVDIDERVLERAKRHAAASGQSLGALVTAALGAFLAARAPPPAPPFELIVRGKPGGRCPSPEDMAALDAEEDVAALRIPGLGRRATS